MNATVMARIPPANNQQTLTSSLRIPARMTPAKTNLAISIKKLTDLAIEFLACISCQLILSHRCQVIKLFSFFVPSPWGGMHGTKIDKKIRTAKRFGEKLLF